MKTRFTGKITLFLLTGGAIVATFAQTALAQDTKAYLYLAHAAPGRNVSSTTNPALPIDISVNGTCIAEGLSFGEIRGPYTLAAGEIAVRISKANSENPCSEPAVFTAGAPLAAGTNYVGAISLAGINIVGRVFPVALPSLAFGHPAVLVLNATNQSLDATEGYTPTTDGSGGRFTVPAGSLRTGFPALGTEYTSIYVTGTNTFEAGPVQVNFVSRVVYLFVLAGQTSNQSIQFIGPALLRDVF